MHIATEISPIFGLSLLAIMEILTISAGFGSFVVAFFIWRTQNGQKNIASANLALKLLKNWNGDSVFTRMILKLEKPNAVFTEKDDVDFVLATFEDIATLWKSKTLTKTHVREFFGRDIVRINANESIMKILNKYHKEDPIHNYNNLKRLLDDSKKWEMKPYSSDESVSVSS